MTCACLRLSTSPRINRGTKIITLKAQNPIKAESPEFVMRLLQEPLCSMEHRFLLAINAPLPSNKFLIVL